MIVKALKPLLGILLTASIAFVELFKDDTTADQSVESSSDERPADPAEAGPVESQATSTVFFAFDDYTLSAETQDQLAALAEYLKQNSGDVIQVEGHCDEKSSIEYNLALGQRRAASVKKYLVQMGVDGARITTISYGEERPAVEGHNEAAWSKNRRAEFVLSKDKNHNMFEEGSKGPLFFVHTSIKP